MFSPPGPRLFQIFNLKAMLSERAPFDLLPGERTLR